MDRGRMRDDFGVATVFALIGLAAMFATAMWIFYEIWRV